MIYLIVIIIAIICLVLVYPCLIVASRQSRMDESNDIGNA